MISRLLFLFAIFAPLGLCQFANGPAEFGLRAELVQNENRDQLKITWSNNGSGPFLFTPGSLVGSVGQSLKLKMSVTGPSIPADNVINGNEPAGAAGRVEFLIVCLTPGAEYAVNIPTDKLFLTRSNKSLKQIRDEPWTLTVLFTGHPSLHFWTTRPCSLRCVARLSQLLSVLDWRSEDRGY